MSFDDRKFDDEDFDDKDFKDRDSYDKDTNDKDFDERDYGHGSNEEEESHSDENDFFKDEDFEFESYEDEDIESQGFRSKRIKQRQKRRKLIFRTIAIMLALVIFAAICVFGYRYIKNKFFSDVEIPEEEVIDIPSSLELGQDINIVIACARGNLLEPEVNSIIFSSFYSSENQLISLCIPVKTLMDVPGIGAELIDRSVEIGGMDLLNLTLEKCLGMDMEVDYYILFDIYNVVNKLEGIDLVLDEEITVRNYDDGSTFKLDKGKNLIDGTEAVNFLKYLSGIEKEVPIENVVKQKLLLDAVIDKIVGENEEVISSNLNLIKDFIDTDLSSEEILKLFSTFSKVESDNNKIYALDVSSTELEGEGIVYLPDVSRLTEIFAKEEAPSEGTAGAEETVDVTILNGVGTPGLAVEVSELLKSQKFENGKNKYNVLEYGNAGNFNYSVTEILVYSDQSYVMEAANSIREILKVGNVAARADEGINSDIIIILGADYSIETAEPVETDETDQFIKINVLNGEGTAKLAATVEEIIEDHFNAEEKILEVVEVKDADNWNYTQTEIIIFTAREGVEALAQQIQERLGVGVIKNSDNNVDNVDITIILGSDYTNQ